MNVVSFKVYIHIASTFSSTYLFILLSVYFIFVKHVQILYTLNLSDIRPKVPSRSLLQVEMSHTMCTYAYDLSPYQISCVHIQRFNTHNYETESRRKLTQNWHICYFTFYEKKNITLTKLHIIVPTSQRIISELKTGGASVDSVSQVRSSAMLLWMTVGNREVRGLEF